jgi:hypothetical protein
MSKYLNLIVIIFAASTINELSCQILSDKERNFIKDSSYVHKLTESQINSFRDKALRKTNDLSEYIKRIGDKGTKSDRKDEAIDLAVDLFINENSIVEVSSLKSPTNNRYKIREYLTKIKLLPYSDVKITWFDLFFASEFIKRPDGKYVAVATVYQQFEGVNIELQSYKDITKKNIEIIIQKIDAQTPEGIKSYWEVVLGDIRVMETKKK